MKRTIKKIFTLCLVLSTLLCLCSCGKVIKGNVTCEGNAKDDMFEIEVDAPILVRTVEMVQYNKNENGEVELVLSNYPIESFDGYTNPEFPSDIVTAIFHGSIKVKDRELNEEEIKSLVYNSVEDLSPYVELNEDSCNQYGMILKDGAYITASNDWKVGEIRVSYSIMNIDPEKEYQALKFEQE